MAPSFRHQPLNHVESSIRLLKILPNSPSDTICCEMQHTTVDTSFICLSYVWGSPETQHKILVNNAEFWIWSNLWDFLCIAKEKYPLTAFWIDAICIDQNSIAERNHQVSLMSDIYSQAERVLAWLGRDEHLVDFMGAWSHNLKPPKNPACNHQEDQLQVLHAWTSAYMNYPEGWLKLRGNEYWSRAWM
jgi:hypothetical protein